jgi:deaminated glutathione amidase
MEIMQTEVFAHPRQRVWESLMDFDVLGRTLPGVESLEQTDSGTARLKLKVMVPSVTGRYEGTVTIVETQPIDSYRLHGEAKGRLGWVKGEATFVLSEVAGGTELCSTMSVQTGGALSGVGQRFMHGIAKSMLRDFFTSFEQQLGSSSGSRTPDVSSELRVACVQLSSSADKDGNLERTEILVGRAAASGADIVVLPERWNCWGTPDDLRAAAETLEDGPSVAAMRGWAHSHGIVLVGGSISERRDGHEKLSNTCVVFDRDGSIAALYRKIHLFDVDIDGQRYRESDTDEAGSEHVVVTAAGCRLGLSICYDLRFPELYRLLALDGAEIVTVPSAFTVHTGKDHWHVLLRARAIENQLFVAAAAQWGASLPGKPTFGHSLVCDPWGTVLAQAPDEETVVVATVDRARIDAVRRSLPSLSSRRLVAYRAATTV